MLILCTAKTVHLSLYTWTMYKWHERRTSRSLCGNSWRKMDLEEPTPLLDKLFLGCAQRECKLIEGSLRKIENIVRILNLSRQGQTIVRLGAIHQRHFFVDFRHGRTHKLMRRKILRIIEWTNRATIQSIHTLRWWPFILKGRTWYSWRITRSMLAERSKNTIIWRASADQTFCGQWTI